MRAPLASLCFASIFAASASGAVGVPDMERGRALYENHCEVCHTSKVHSRINRLPIGIEELRQIVSSLPLCRYPQYPRFKGEGDPKKADSYTCSMP